LNKIDGEPIHSSKIDHRKLKILILNLVNSILDFHQDFHATLMMVSILFGTHVYSRTARFRQAGILGFHHHLNRMISAPDAMMMHDPQSDRTENHHKSNGQSNESNHIKDKINKNNFQSLLRNV